jgi:hypothetical protein
VVVGGGVVADRATPVGDVDPLQEARDDLAQLGEHEVGVGPGLGQRVRAHPQQQGFVGLAGAVDADVGQGRRRQDAADRVERLGPDGLAVDEVAVARLLGEAVAEEVDHGGRHLGVGVEQPVEVADEPEAQRAGEDLGRPVEAVAAVEAAVVVDVPGRLLEVGHQPTPLEHLRQQVRRLLAREVDAAQLGDRVVAVLEEDLVVELLGPVEPDRGVDRGVPRDVEVADELVEEQAAQALGRARVPGEQRTLDDLGQVHQREDRAVEIGEVTPQHVGLVCGELLGDVEGHTSRDATSAPHAGRGC